jgi:hypothetical protein
LLPSSILSDFTPDNVDVTPNQADPKGGTDAYLISPSSGTATARIYSDNIAANGNETFSISVKNSGWQWIAIAPATSPASGAVWFDVQNGQVGTEKSGYSGFISENPDDPSFYDISITSAFVGATRFRLYLSDSDDGATATASANGVIAYGPQIELGSTATDYQKVVSEYDVTEAGVTSLDYLSFDGSDDQLLTGDIDFSSVTEMSAFAAATKLTDVRAAISHYSNNASSADIRLEHSSTLFGGDDGSYKAFLRRTSGVDLPDFSAFVTPTDYTGVQTNVLAMTADRSTSGNSAVTFRINSNVPASNVTNATGVNSSNPAHFDTGKISIGSLVNGNHPLDGNLYGLIVRGATSTTDEITSTEAYLAAKSGVTL